MTAMGIPANAKQLAARVKEGGGMDLRVNNRTRAIANHTRVNNRTVRQTRHEPEEGDTR